MGNASLRGGLRISHALEDLELHRQRSCAVGSEVRQPLPPLG